MKMDFVFRNFDGQVELSLCEQIHSEDSIVFVCSVHHAPFNAELSVYISLTEISYFADGLKQMELFHLDTLSLVTLDRDVIITLKMDETGHIVAFVTVSSGARGFLKFDFDFDQSFVKQIINYEA